MCSETSEAVGTTWEHAQLEFQKFLKIRIPLISYFPETVDEGKRSEDGARSRNQSGEEVTPCLEEDSYHINCHCH